MIVLLKEVVVHVVKRKLLLSAKCATAGEMWVDMLSSVHMGHRERSVVWYYPSFLNPLV